jgi:predicted nucleic acid-binding protein
MNIVIDTSVIIAIITNAAEKEALIRLTEGCDLVAPASVHWEVGNAFSAMLKKKRITLHQALRAIAIYHDLPIRFAEVEIGDALQIAAEKNLYAYDAYLIRCAQKYNSKLVTLDQNLMQAAIQLGIPVMELNR